MPFYLYSAFDAAGKQLEGTIQAQTANEALHSLITRGFKKPRIVGEKSAAVPSVAPARQVAPISQATSHVQINVPVAAPAPHIHRSRKSSDRERFFLFAQIADQLRAGINPAQTFGELARTYKQQKFRQSLAMVANAAAEGRPISDVLALWPDLYPDHVVGLIRAGETGGFLPDAAATVSEQAFNAHKFKRFHWWIWLVAVNSIAIPMVFMLRHSMLAMFDAASAAPDERTGTRDVYAAMGKTFLWWLPILIGLVVVALVLRYIFSTRGVRKFRHEVGLRMPILGGRARNESVTVFTWVLSKLAKSGVPPNRSWQLAVDSVPNIAMQERLRRAGVMMNEGSRLSDVVFGSNLFPEEYAPAIATGELTGDISGALDRLSQVSKTEFDAGTVKSKAFTGSLGCTAMLIVSGIILIVLASTCERDLPEKAVQGTPLDPNSSYNQE